MIKINWIIGMMLCLYFTACTEQKNDTEFQQLADAYLEDYLQFRPQYGVYLGLHQYDGKIVDYSKATIEAELNQLKEYDKKFAAIDAKKLSKTAYYDWKMLVSSIKNEIFQIEDIGVYTKNPMTYSNIFDLNIYVKRNFAPLEQQVKSIISIEEKLPEIYKNAQLNLQDSLALPHIQLAIDIAKGNASFLENDLVVALKELKDTALFNQFERTNKNAIQALNNYATFLEKEKLPKANNKYAIGAANYQKMLLYGEEINLSADEILAIGLRELQKEQAAFDAAAKIIDATKNPVDVYNEVQKEHPTAANLIPDAKKNLEAIRQYVIDRKLVTIPSEVRVKVEETPMYARATTTASMDTPGPFEEKATEAYYYITPVDLKWNAQQQEEWLASFNYYTTDVVSIHEAYPGHYTQFLHLNASKASKVQKILGSYAFIEGWAHYTEKMVIDDGFSNGGDALQAAKYRIAQSGDALLRLCRLCVSIKMHCHGMQVDEATKFFMDNWHQGEVPSKQEALRGTFDPGYLYYTLGKLQILKLKADYQKQEGKNFNVQKFHDAVLDNGMPPIRLLREMLLKDEKSWNEIL